MSIFVVGDKNTVLGFNLIGVDGKAVSRVDEARSTLEEALAEDGIEILLITENLTSNLREWVDELKMTSLHPVVLEIPSSEPAPSGRSLRRLVQEAIGIRLGA